MQERRLYKRYILDVIDIRSNMIFATDVKILDISLGGVSLRADKRLNMGGGYILKINARDRMINIRGEVIWSLLSEHRETPRGEIVPIYKAGMKFIHISDEKLSEIMQFIETYKREANEPIFVCQLSDQRLFKRLKLETPEGASVEHRYEGCVVKTLSASGMLIECEFPLSLEERMPMKLTLTDDKYITFQGRVASCILIAGTIPDSYYVGIEFFNMSGKDKDTLTAFVSLLDTIDKSPSF